MVVHRLPRREVVGQHPPLHAGFRPIEYRVDNLFTVMLAGIPTRVFWFKVVFYQPPFFIGQIAWIAHFPYPKKCLTLTFIFFARQLLKQGPIGF